MTNQVIAILPGDVVKKISVPADASDAYFIGENGSQLLLPLETYIFEGQEYLIARYSDCVKNERIELAIKTGK